MCDNVITTKQAAKLLHVKPDGARYTLGVAHIQPVGKIGREYLYNRADVLKLVAERDKAKEPKPKKALKQTGQLVLPLQSNDQALTRIAEELADLKAWMLYLAGAGMRPAANVPLGVRPANKGNGERLTQAKTAWEAAHRANDQPAPPTPKLFNVGDIEAAEARLLTFLGGKNEVKATDARKAMFPGIASGGSYHSAMEHAMLALGWVKVKRKAPGHDLKLYTTAFWQDPHPSHPVGPVPPAVPAGPRTID